jgi:hypothetical protein
MSRKLSSRLDRLERRADSPEERRVPPWFWPWFLQGYEPPPGAVLPQWLYDHLEETARRVVEDERHELGPVERRIEEILTEGDSHDPAE